MNSAHGPTRTPGSRRPPGSTSTQTDAFGIGEDTAPACPGETTAATRLRPPAVFSDGGFSRLEPGFHRIEAHKPTANRATGCKPPDGRLRDAVALWPGRTRTLCSRRTNPDRRRTARTAPKTPPEVASNAEIPRKGRARRGFVAAPCEVRDSEVSPPPLRPAGSPNKEHDREPADAAGPDPPSKLHRTSGDRSERDGIAASIAERAAFSRKMRAHATEAEDTPGRPANGIDRFTNKSERAPPIGVQDQPDGVRTSIATIDPTAGPGRLLGRREDVLNQRWSAVHRLRRAVDRLRGFPDDFRNHEQLGVLSPRGCGLWL